MKKELAYSCSNKNKSKKAEIKTSMLVKQAIIEKLRTTNYNKIKLYYNNVK